MSGSMPGTHFRSLEFGQLHPGLAKASMNEGYYQRFFEELRMLGRGGFGSVHLCRHVLDGEDLGYYAVKKVPIGDSHDWLMTVLREVRSLESLKHENIVDYKHTWLETHQAADFGPSVPCAFILMEYADLGNLTTLVQNSASLSDDEVLFYFLQICRGLRHLHHCGIIYGDLKPENILLKSDHDALTGIDSIQLLLSDFGTSANIATYPRHRSGCSGTLRYTAPEILRAVERGGLNSHASDGQRADIWGAGAVLFALVYGHDAFGSTGDESADDVLAEILLREGIPLFPESTSRSASFQPLITDLMSPHPAARPSIDAIFDHPSVATLLQHSSSYPPPHSDHSSASRHPTPSPLLLTDAFHSTPTPSPPPHLSYTPLLLPALALLTPPTLPASLLLTFLTLLLLHPSTSTPSHHHPLLPTLLLLLHLTSMQLPSS